MLEAIISTATVREPLTDDSCRCTPLKSNTTFRRRSRADVFQVPVGHRSGRPAACDDTLLSYPKVVDSSRGHRRSAPEGPGHLGRPKHLHSEELLTGDCGSRLATMLTGTSRARDAHIVANPEVVVDCEGFVGSVPWPTGQFIVSLTSGTIAAAQHANINSPAGCYRPMQDASRRRRLHWPEGFSDRYRFETPPANQAPGPRTSPLAPSRFRLTSDIPILHQELPEVKKLPTGCAQIKTGLRGLGPG